MNVVRFLILLLLFPLHLLSGADNFSAATVLTGASATSTESSQNATSEAGEPALIGSSYRSLWWKWKAPSKGRVTVDLTGSSTTSGAAGFGKYVFTYVAKSSPAIVGSLAAVEAAGGSNVYEPSSSFPVVSGTTYFIQVVSVNQAHFGSIRTNITLDTNTDINQLNVVGSGDLTNDAFASRSVLAGTEVTAISYTYAATTEPSEPGNGTKTVWWTWTAPAHGRLRISTTGSQTSSWGKILGVYLGNSLSTLRPLVGASGIINYTPTVELPVTAGQTYQIALGSDSGGDGSLVITLGLSTTTDINQLNIGAPASYANDFFANRVTLPAAASVSVIGYGNYTSNEALEPANAGYGTLWWTYTAPSAGTITLSTLGSSTQNGKSLSVWTGGSPGTLIQVARASGIVSYTPSLTFSAALGQTYQICVGAANSGATPGHVVLSLGGPPGPLDSPITGLNIDRAVRLRWHTVTGTNYRVRTSDNMTSWTNFGDVIIGDGTVREVYQPVSRTAEFFRVVPQ